MPNNGKYLGLTNGEPAEENAIATSAGAGDASKVIRTNASGKLDITLIPNGVGIPTKQATASEALSAGNLVNFWLDTGTLKVRKADGSADAKEADGYVVANVAQNAAATVYLLGINDQMSGLTPGAKYFLSNVTAGTVQTAEVTTSGHYSQYVGDALSTTELDFRRGLAIKRA